MTDRELAEATAAKDELLYMRRIREVFINEFSRKRPRARCVYVIAGGAGDLLYDKQGRLRKVLIGPVKEIYPILLEKIDYAIDKAEAYLESL